MGLSQVESGGRYKRVYHHAWRRMYAPGSGAENESASACVEWSELNECQRRMTVICVLRM